MSRERPILFSGPMVRAILEGRKTQTRRIVKPVHVAAYHDGVPSLFKRLPYGKPGDRLYVRETWRTLAFLDKVRPEGFEKANYKHRVECSVIQYAASLEESSEEEKRFDWGRWRPSIHIPREFSRILLEVVSVRVERLQDISEEDAKAEGMMWIPGEEIGGYSAGRGHGHWNTAKDAFCDLWVSINSIESWEANPWVWAVTFKRIH